MKVRNRTAPSAMKANLDVVFFFNSLKFRKRGVLTRLENP